MIMAALGFGDGQYPRCQLMLRKLWTGFHMNEEIKAESCEKFREEDP
jgi:hypothetical protein